mgnify:CR=1 FL=1
MIMSINENKIKVTPLMKQYNAIKKEHPKALLLFRVGDFYETFGEDAIKASKTLEIVLTKRANGAASHIELAGFPHHALDNYLPKLIRAGYRVAVCDQLEDPKTTKGIVKRGVTELVTPGLSLSDNILEAKKNNYLASLSREGDMFGIALLDISTGEFVLSRGNIELIEKILYSFNPSEIICSKSEKEYFSTLFESKSIYYLDDWIYKIGYAYDKLTSFFKVQNLKGFGIEELKEGIISAASILFYLENTEHLELGHISTISRIENDNYMWLDRFTINNLEIVKPLNEKSSSLLDIINTTVTPMGSRLLNRWLILPLLNKKKIKRRQDFVQVFLENNVLLTDIRNTLKNIYDIERIISKVSVRRVNPKELIQLKHSLINISEIKLLLKHSKNKILVAFNKEINACSEVSQIIEKNLREDAPFGINQGRIFLDGVNEELDELRKISTSGKDYLLRIQNREIKNTGISSLKIAYNKVFGYYLEVTNAHKEKVPENWIRKQTLVNAERYVTEDLKIYEEKILNAEEKIISLEYELYQNLLNKIVNYVIKIQSTSKKIAFIDCVHSFADLAFSSNFCRPMITKQYNLDIKKGRHIIIEKLFPPEQVYIPNDIYLDNKKQQIIIVTGPNMAGKSALIRQTALIVIMAQIGAFIPAASAKIGIIDKIFTRVGASDNIAQGESTFMVEMTETASIMNNLSNRSLILMDEIGRGTSTYDGISIAWSIVEFLHNHPKYKPLTLFATHYHELNELSIQLSRVKNFNVAVKKINNEILFLRKLVPGGTEHSFGINVAQLAGMPNQILIRSYEILKLLEKKSIKNKKQTKIGKKLKSIKQLKIFQSDPKVEKCLKLLKEINIDKISPLQALLKLNQILDILNREK